MACVDLSITESAAIGQSAVVAVVDVLVLHHLVHFLTKGIKVKKILPGRDLNLEPPDHQTSTLPTEL